MLKSLVTFLVVLAGLAGSFVVADNLVETNFSPADILLAAILLVIYLNGCKEET